MLTGQDGRRASEAGRRVGALTCLDVFFELHRSHCEGLRRQTELQYSLRQTPTLRAHGLQIELTCLYNMLYPDHPLLLSLEDKHSPLPRFD